MFVSVTTSIYANPDSHSKGPSDKGEGKGSGKTGARTTRSGPPPNGSGARSSGHWKRSEEGKEGGGEDIFDDDNDDPIVARVVLRSVPAEVGATESWDSDVYYGSLAETKQVVQYWIHGGG